MPPTAVRLVSVSGRPDLVVAEGTGDELHLHGPAERPVLLAASHKGGDQVHLQRLAVDAALRHCTPQTTLRRL